MIPVSSEMLQKWMPKMSWKHVHHKHSNSFEKILQPKPKLLPKSAPKMNPSSAEQKKTRQVVKTYVASKLTFMCM